MLKNKSADAIAALESARKYELGAQGPGANYGPLYIRGLAFLRLKDGSKAAAEFQKILDHRDAGATSHLYTLAQLNLGRAYALQGDSAKARIAYQDYFAA